MYFINFSLMGSRVSVFIVFIVALARGQVQNDSRGPSVDRTTPNWEQAVAEPVLNGMEVFPFSFRGGSVQSWVIPASCAALHKADPATCSGARPLYHSLTPRPSAPGLPTTWTLTLTHPGPVSNTWLQDVGGVALWCHRCQFEGAPHAGSTSAGTAAGAVPLATLPLRAAASGGNAKASAPRRPCPFRSKGPDAEPAGAVRQAQHADMADAPLMVAVLVSDARLPTAPPVPLQGPSPTQANPLALEGRGTGEATAAARKLLQSPPSSCSLTVSGTTHTFDACPSVERSNAAYQLFLSVSENKGAVTLRGGMRVAAAGSWAGWGLGSSRMFGTQAAIVTDDPTSPTGASVAGYLMPNSYAAPAINAARGTWELADAAAALDNGDLVCVFTATLDQTLDSFTGPNIPYIWAVGPMSSSGSGDIMFHYDWGYGLVTITPSSVGPLSSGGSPLNHGGGYASSEVVLEGGTVGAVDSRGKSFLAKYRVHGWLMTISWGVLIPIGIVMARNFKELDPLWFHVHRALQTLAFLMGIAGILVGFATRGWTWARPYPVHRNLGIAVMALGAAQITALVARPSPNHQLRWVWKWGHRWVGWAAAACAIANIYYGIIHVDELGAWAWAAYTAVLATIVAVSVFKEGWDLWQRRQLAGVAKGEKDAQFVTRAEGVEEGVGLRAATA